MTSPEKVKSAVQDYRSGRLFEIESKMDFALVQARERGLIQAVVEIQDYSEQIQMEVENGLVKRYLEAGFRWAKVLRDSNVTAVRFCVSTEPKYNE